MAVKKCKKHPDDACYDVDWRPNGRNGTHCQRHFEGTEAAAMAFWLEMVRLARVAKHQPVGLDPTVYELIPTWMESYGNEHLPNTVRDLNYCLVPLVRHLGNFHLSELAAPIIIEQYKTKRLDTPIIPKKRKKESDEAYKVRVAKDTRKLSKRTVAKELSYFSSFLTWCNDHGYLQQKIHVKNFPAKQTTRKDPIRPLHRDDITLLVDVIEPQYRPIILCMTDAGLRRSEALTLHAEQVDLRRRIIIVRGKGDKERIMPIASHRLLQALTESLAKKKKGLLFENPKTEKPFYSIRKAIIRAAAAAGIDQRTYHHLMRHSFGTNAIVAGASLKGVQGMLGHVSSQTTELYVHLAGMYFQDEAAKLGAYFDPQPEKTPEAEEGPDTESFGSKRKS
jgi:site-specific recombinase XerD